MNLPRGHNMDFYRPCMQCTLLFTLVFFSFTAFAMTTWKIVPEKSHLSFSGIQNGAPVTGEFKTFSGDIQFDPDQLKESKIKISIDMGSVSAPYDELRDTLKTADWFNIRLFPTATFQADQVVKLNDTTYQAKGRLSIKNKTLPVAVSFQVDKQTEDEVHASGSALLKRSDFGVGQGEWASTEEIKDEVKVDFALTASKR